jgi:hypothetical protein
MEIWNVQETTMLSIQFNPRKLPEKLKAVWKKHVVPGMSHPVMQYNHTDALQVTLDLLWSVQTKDDLQRLGEARKFIMAMMVPWRGYTSPPRALLNWPNLLSLNAVILDLDGGHEYFDGDLNTSWYTAKLTVEEIRDGRLYGDDVLRNGTRRGTGGSLV